MILYLDKNHWHSIMLHINSVWNKDKNNYYCNIFLEESSYEQPKNVNNK